jgi:hypothetical protein
VNDIKVKVVRAVRIALELFGVKNWSVIEVGTMTSANGRVVRFKDEVGLLGRRKGLFGN